MRKRRHSVDPALVVGIAGGSGSGKSTLARRLCERLGPAAVFLTQDVYYNDVDEALFTPRVWNYDHPEALDLALFARHVQSLRDGEPVEIPAYDFGLYRRTGEARRVEPAPVIVLEGTLILAQPCLRDLVDVRVYVDAPDDVRFIRRLRRDILERGRDVETVTEQYVTWNRPMHARFVAPSREFAHIVVPGGGWNTRALEAILGMVRMLRPSLEILPARPETLEGDET
jgi:uridine kinase